MARARWVSVVVAAAVALTLGGVSPAGAAPGRAVAPAEVQFPTPEAAPRAAGAVAGGAGVVGSAVAASAFSDGLLRRTVTIADPRESASPSASQRVTRVVATQDLVARNLKATLSFASMPTAAAPAVVIVWLGEWDGSSCSPRVALGVESRPGGPASGAHVSAAGVVSGSFGVSRADRGANVTLTSSAAGTFRDADLECGFATVQSTDGATRYQSFYAEGMDEVYKPVLGMTGGEPVQGARAGKWTTLRLDVRNSGRGAANNVRISAKGASMTIKNASRSLGTIEDRSTKYGVVYKVKLKGAKSRKITFTVTADGGYKATKSFTIARTPAPTKYKSLAGRYFWGYQPTNVGSYSGWDNTTMWFVDKKWVYVGDAKGRTPKCRTTTKTCKRYSYDARRGVAKIGKQKFTVRTTGYSYRVAKGEQKSSFSPATLPKKGARFTADLVHQNWSGYCLLSCTSWTERLTLAKNGRFVWARTSIGSWPGIGQYWSSAPPANRGTYKVVKKGVVELRYANGEKERMSIAIEHDVRGKPSPAGAGLILGLTNFYFQD